MIARNVAMVASLLILAAHVAAQAQPSVPQAVPDGGFVPPPVDPRVQIRTYRFENRNEDIPYGVFVSSKVRPERKNPLVVALHGLCGSHTSLLRGNVLDLAEEGGYILVGPMGYNPRGWYGIPARPRPAGAGRGGAREPFVAENDPPNLRELSERDVMNVLEMIREEFNVDERRTYLMGHSMGGAGTLYLGTKYPEQWAALAAIAPAAFGLDPQSIATVPDMPVVIVHGDMDTAVPVEVSQSWAAVLQENDMTYDYLEVVNGDHGNVISIGMPTIFEFFGRHKKPRSR
jgi:predicted peptidase